MQLGKTSNDSTNAQIINTPISIDQIGFEKISPIKRETRQNGARTGKQNTSSGPLLQR